MAIYARGYRPYVGEGKGAPAWVVIYREAYRLAFKNLGFRIIGTLFIVWFVMWASVLYFTLGIEEAAQQASRGMLQTSVADQLRVTLMRFYSGVSVLTALLAVLTGAGLIADDLRTRALSLYLVRPLRNWEYVLGKALVLPHILAWTVLLPGLLFYVLVAMWHAPGNTFGWLADNIEIIDSVILTYLISTFSYTGLMLLLSARTDRRGGVIAISAAIIFAGSLLVPILSQVDSVRDVAKHAGLPINAVSAIARDAATAQLMGRNRPEQLEEVLSFIPEPGVSLGIGLVLLALGLYSGLRRAATVEVSA